MAPSAVPPSIPDYSWFVSAIGERLECLEVEPLKQRTRERLAEEILVAYQLMALAYKDAGLCTSDLIRQFGYDLDFLVTTHALPKVPPLTGFFSPDRAVLASAVARRVLPKIDEADEELAGRLELGTADTRRASAFMRASGPADARVVRMLGFRR